MPKLLHRLRSLLHELRRRKVVRAVAAYSVAAAGLIGFSGDLTQALGLPPGMPFYIVIGSLVGLPIVVAVTWLFEVVPDAGADVAAGAPADVAAPASAPAPASAADADTPEPLPTPGTAFIGRQRELAELLDLLRDPATRLVTVTGPGGIGKTRLALTAAERVLEEFEHGVRYVALSALPRPELLAPAIAESLGLRLARRDDAGEELLDYLRDKRLLLVLDNFDDLVAGAAIVSQILEAAPDVRALVTSRERLNLLPEVLLPLDGMAVTGVADADGDAVQLFVAAARRQDRHFALDATNREHVRRICALVGGLPLAIELAAAWTRVLSCEEIHRDVAHNFDMLSSTAPDLPERHRSLRAAFTSSWRLLSPEEQRAVSALSVIRSDFDRETAVAVADADIPLLRSLLDKSFLTRAGGQFLMLAVVREYALDRLRDSPADESAVRQRHLQYFCGLLAGLEQDAVRWNPRAFARIAEDIDDVRAAWTYATYAADAAALQRAANSLFHFYDARGWAQEGTEAFARSARALAKAGLSPDQPLRADTHMRLTLRCGALLSRLARYAESESVLQRGLADARACENTAETIFGLQRLASARMSVGEYDHAEELLQEALSLATALRGSYDLGWSKAYLGNVELARGRYDSAAQLYSDALELLRAEDDRHGMWVTTNNLGVIAGIRAQHAEARRRFEEGLALQRELGNRYSIAMLLHNAGCAADDAGDPVTARSYLEQSVAMSDRMGYQGMVALSLAALANVLIRLGDADAARATVHRALRIAVDLKKYPTAIEAMLSLARLRMHDGDPSGAVRVAAVIAAHPVTDESTRQRAIALLNTMNRSAITPGEPVDLAAFAHDVLADADTDTYLALAADASGVPGMRGA